MKEGFILIVQICELTFREVKYSGQGHTERKKQSHGATSSSFLLFFHSVFHSTS